MDEGAGAVLQSAAQGGDRLPPYEAGDGATKLSARNSKAVRIFRVGPSPMIPSLRKSALPVPWKRREGEASDGEVREGNSENHTTVDEDGKEHVREELTASDGDTAGPVQENADRTVFTGSQEDLADDARSKSSRCHPKEEFDGGSEEKDRGKKRRRLD